MVKTPKVARVPAMEALAVKVDCASSPKMMGPAASAQAALKRLSFCRGTGARAAAGGDGTEAAAVGQRSACPHARCPPRPAGVRRSLHPNPSPLCCAGHLDLANRRAKGSGVHVVLSSLLLLPGHLAARAVGGEVAAGGAQLVMQRLQQAAAPDQLLRQAARHEGPQRGGTRHPRHGV